MPEICIDIECFDYECLDYEAFMRGAFDRPRRAHIAANNKEMQALLLSLHATTVALQAA